MAIALVSAGTPITTLSPAFGQPTGAGSLLIGCVAANVASAGNPFSVTGTGWALAIAYGVSYSWAAVYYKPGSAAGETAPTFSQSGGGGPLASVLAEFSGAATSSPLDSSGTSATGTAANAASDTGGGDLIVAFATDTYYDGAAFTAPAMYDSSGASVTSALLASGYPGGGWNYGFAYGVAGPGGTSKDTVTWNYSTTYSAIVSFMAPQGTNTSPAYATAYDTGSGGSGSWTSPGNADGAPDGACATWVAP